MYAAWKILSVWSGPALTLPVTLALALALALSACSDPDAAWAGGWQEPGRWVTWASNREDGRHEIYLMEVDDGQARRMTFDGGRRPLWSPDGRWIAYYHETDWTTRVVRPDGSDDRLACKGEIRYWMHDNSGMICRSGDDYLLVDPDLEGWAPGKRVFRRSDFTKITSPVFDTCGATHDGRYVLAVTDQYRSGFTGSNGTFTATWAAVVLDLQHPDQLHYFGAGCQPTTPPRGKLIYHVCRGTATSPDLYRMELADLAQRTTYTAEVDYANPDWGHEYFPSVSNDNMWIVYGATTGCHDFDTCDYVC